MTKPKLNMYKVTIYLIKDEKRFGRDWECEEYHLWSDQREVLVAASSIPEALEIAKAEAIQKGNKWRSIDHSEELKPRHYRSHTIRNNEYIDKLQELYG